MTMSCDDAGIGVVRRFEVFTGAGKRRDWSPEAKAAIVAESHSGAESVCAVARRHGLSPSQLFTWRREFRKQPEGQHPAPPAVVLTPPFVPAVIEPSPRPAARRARRRRSQTSAVELEIDGVAVKISAGKDSGLIAAVIEALKATR
jgi:transposase